MNIHDRLALLDECLEARREVLAFFREHLFGRSPELCPPEWVRLHQVFWDAREKYEAAIRKDERERITNSMENLSAHAPKQ